MEGIQEKQVSFYHRIDERLYGILTLPPGRKKVPAVIMCHGFAGTKSERKFVELARALAKENIASLRFDFSGCGDSEGSLENMSIGKQTRELFIAREFLKEKSRINEKIGLFGHSLGALIACWNVSVFPDRTEAFVFATPALNQKELIKIWYSEEERDLWKKQRYLDTPKGRIGVNYLKEAERFNYRPTSVLMLHGSNDKDVPIEFSEQLISKARDIHLIRIPDADHKLESYKAKKEIINHSVKWFKKYLGAE